MDMGCLTKDFQTECFCRVGLRTAREQLAEVPGKRRTMMRENDGKVWGITNFWLGFTAVTLKFFING